MSCGIRINFFLAMPSLDVHYHLTQRAFGAKFEHVRLWLNEFGREHRCRRHHEEGIDAVRQLFGETAAEVARMHIEMDLMEDGWIFGDPFPRCEADYISLGLL